MDSSDILGHDGREAVFAVIKVSVLKKKTRTVHQTVSEFMKGRGRKIPNDLDQIPNDKCTFNIPIAEDTSEDDYEEVDYGTGFIIRNKLIITAYHVVADATGNSAVEMEIRVSNARIQNGLKCLVVKCDEQNDLALLECEELDVKKIGISPLQLSKQAPLQGMSVFTLGYPVSHTGKTALFLNGYVAGETGERHGRPDPLMTLNIPLDCGSSGAPVFWRWKGELSVVAVVKEKHLKRVSSCWEESLVERVRSSLNTFSTDTINWDLQAVVGMLRTFASLMNKWLDSSEKNCQRYLSNAVQAHFVSDLLKKL